MSKIIFINRYYSPDHSATAQLMTDLAEFLVKEGANIYVVTSRLRYEGESTLCPSETIKGVQVRRVWTSSFGRGNLLGRALDYLTFYISIVWVLLSLTKRGDTLVAKTDPPLISVVVALVATIKRANLVNWVQDLFPEVAIAANVKLVKGLVGAVLIRVRNLSLNTAKHNVVIGQLMFEKLQRQGIKQETLSIIPNWVVQKNIIPVAKEDNRLRREWGLSNKYIVGYSGNLGTAHDHISILHSMIKLRDDRRIQFLFIGGGTGMLFLKQACQDLNLNNVLFKPYQALSHLSESLCVPDVHIISLKPYMEGLIVPSKLYGVLSVGRPILNIGDAQGEIGRLVQAFGCGENVDSRKKTDLTDTILSLFENNERGIDYGANAARLFEEKFAYGLSKAQWAHVLLGER